MSDASRKRSLHELYRHTYLLVALLTMVFARPFLDTGALTTSLLDLMLALPIIGAIFVSATTRSSFFAAISLGCIITISRIVGAGDAPPAWCAPVFLVSMIAFNVGIALLILWQVLQPNRRVTTDTILGVISAYLLLGVAWACAFALLELNAPGSFDFGERQLDNAPRQFWTFLGFSFTTLTTLGYGNIAPMTPRADALATSQAVAGQFYIAVLVARLVSLQITQRGTDAANADN